MTGHGGAEVPTAEVPTAEVPTAEVPLFTPAFLALAAADLAYFTAAGVLIPIVPLFAKSALGADPVGVGVAVGAFSVTALLVRPFAGRLSDRRGRRPLLLAGALMFAGVVVAHTLATHLAVLVGLRLLLGVAEALFFVAGFAALADLAPPNRAGEALSFNSLALYLGIAFGPTVGRVLLDAGGFTLVWVGAGLLALMAAVLATRLPETAPLTPEAEPTPLIHRGVVAPALALFSAVAGAAGFFTFVALRAEELGSDDWSIVLLAYGLVVVVCRIVFARLADRVPPFWLGAAALGLCAAGLLVASVAPGFAGLFAGAVILALGVAFATPAFFAAIFARVERSDHGAAAGTVSVMLDLAFAGGPVVAGIAAAMAGIPVAFAVLAAISAAGAIGTVQLALSARPRSPTA